MALAAVDRLCVCVCVVDCGFLYSPMMVFSMSVCVCVCVLLQTGSEVLSPSEVISKALTRVPGSGAASVCVAYVDRYVYARTLALTISHHASKACPTHTRARAAG